MTGNIQPNICSDEAVKIPFFQVGEERSRSFEMKWCRRIQEGHAYCEADWAAVMIAAGTQF